MKNRLVFTAFLVLILGVSACASAAPTPSAMPVSAYVATAVTMVPTATMIRPKIPTGAAIVDLGHNSGLGSILVDSSGMDLYIYTKDSPNKSTCFDECATNWPPLLSNGVPVGGTGITASLLGTTMRPDGTVQVTYNGWPLYHYSKDTTPGDCNGHSLDGVWYLITPNGNQG